MEPAFVAVECGGVAFKCFTSLCTQRALPRIGETAVLYTQLNVREDALDLFGFATKAELSCFKMLTAISGVGPKVGLAILSEMTPERVAIAAAGGDSKSFTRAAGVGPKLAQRIILELKDKVKKMGISEDFSPAPGGGVPDASSHAAEAVRALAVLGYSQSEAAEAVAKHDSALPTEELIRLALKGMASRF